MTICPRNRHSTSRRNKKRAHQGRSVKNFVACKNCGVRKKSHIICPECGFYAERNLFPEESE